MHVIPPEYSKNPSERWKLRIRVYQYRYLRVAYWNLASCVRLNYGLRLCGFDLCAKFQSHCAFQDHLYLSKFDGLPIKFTIKTQSAISWKPAVLTFCSPIACWIFALANFIEASFCRGNESIYQAINGTPSYEFCRHSLMRFFTTDDFFFLGTAKKKLSFSMLIND